MADILNFPKHHAKFPGNGARETLIEHAVEEFANTKADAEKWADFTLASLWARGFKVVPVDD